jgi:hypothetical protein
MSEEQEAPASPPVAEPVAREGRFPLAFDTNGDPLDVPAHAVAWRVRRGGGRRGRPSHVFDSETGRQLEIPLGATLETLIEAGCPPDRYLLYPVDGEGHIIPGVIAVTWLSESQAGEEDGSGGTPPGGAAAPVRVDAVTQLAMQQHVTIQRMCEYLCRGFEAAASGYGPVRPMQKPQPTVIEAPPAPTPEPPSGLKAEQVAEVMQLARAVFEMFRGSVPPPPSPTNS